MANGPNVVDASLRSAARVAALAFIIPTDLSCTATSACAAAFS
jgi:hypothetical protein